MTNKLFNELMQKNAENIYSTSITKPSHFMESKKEADKAERIAKAKADAEKKKAKTAGAKAAKTKTKAKTAKRKTAKKGFKSNEEFRAFVYEKLGLSPGEIEYGPIVKMYR